MIQFHCVITLFLISTDMCLRTNVPFQYTISGNREQVFLLYYKDFFEQICSDVQFISPPEEVGEFLLHLLKWLIVLYWFLNLLCCLIIARAFHNISLREKRHELLVKQMSFFRNSWNIQPKWNKNINLCENGITIWKTISFH